MALAIGIVRKGGIPALNVDYFQRVILDENTQMVAFLAIASMSS